MKCLKFDNPEMKLYIKSMGKVFRVTAICQTQDEANAVMENDPDQALIVTEQIHDLHFLASLKGLACSADAIQDGEPEEEDVCQPIETPSYLEPLANFLNDLKGIGFGTDESIDGSDAVDTINNHWDALQFFARYGGRPESLVAAFIHSLPQNDERLRLPDGTEWTAATLRQLLTPFVRWFGS